MVQNHISFSSLETDSFRDLCATFSKGKYTPPERHDIQLLMKKKQIEIEQKVIITYCK
jgi:hypothetical protein